MTAKNATPPPNGTQYDDTVWLYLAGMVAIPLIFLALIQKYRNK